MCMIHAHRFSLTIMALASLCVLNACADLSIGVDVYKGDLLMSNDAKIGKAVGDAKAAYEFAVWYKAGKQKAVAKGAAAPQSDNSNEDQNLIDFMGKITAVFESEHIEDNWAKFKELTPPTRQFESLYQSQPDEARRDSKQFNDCVVYMDARRKLALSLFRFAALCIDVGQNRALQEAMLFQTTPDAIFLAWSGESRIGRFTLGVGLEQIGTKIMLMVDDVLDPTQRQTIAHLMQSVTQGLVVETATTGLFNGKNILSHMTGIADGLESQYWANINNISVSGIGNQQYVIIKDEVGNWHIKSIISDQNAVVDAVFDTTTGLINTIASHYGFSLNASNPAAGQGTQSSETASLQTQAAQVDNAKKELNAANAAFKNAVNSALLLTNGSPAQRAALADAATIYQAQVSSISYTPPGTNVPNTTGGDSSSKSQGTTSATQPAAAASPAENNSLPAATKP